jgi:hypothetical protein
LVQINIRLEEDLSQNMNKHQKGEYTRVGTYNWLLDGVEQPVYSYFLFGGHEPSGRYADTFRGRIIKWKIDGIPLDEEEYIGELGIFLEVGIHAISVDIDIYSTSFEKRGREEIKVRDSFKTNGPVTFIHNFEKDKLYRLAVTPVSGDSKPSGNSDNSNTSFHLSIEEEK